MQRWWISDSSDQQINKTINQSQTYANKNKDNKETSDFQQWKFKVFVNFELNQFGNSCLYTHYIYLILTSFNVIF